MAPRVDLFVAALAADGAGNLYVGYRGDTGGLSWPYYWIQKRDPQGNWSVMATHGLFLGWVEDLKALAVDTEGNLYVAERFNEVRMRDAQGLWSVIATKGEALGQVTNPTALAVDTAGNLYVAEYVIYRPAYGYSGVNRIQKRDAQGNWSVVDGPYDGAYGRVSALAVDSAGTLYVAMDVGDPSEYPIFRFWKRDAQGNWSMIATEGHAPGQVIDVPALAADTAGNLYVAEMIDYAGWTSRIQKRDAQGNWSVLATDGQAIGQVSFDSLYRYGAGLAVDAAGNLYVAEAGNNRVQKFTPLP
jgi:hypothetical protein